ncbi:MAG: Pycsar system effector family protein [Brevibacterium linens]|uniref:Pycsar system effector family protein n=1 Tax=Brevibacterium linens TaxID=1703 RepID=UPI003F956E97
MGLPDPDPDNAWNTLHLMQDMIRHSDVKAGVALAFVGALATITFDLTRVDSDPSNLSIAIIGLTCALLIASGVLCGLTLSPRLIAPNDDSHAVNHLFFIDISTRFRGQPNEFASEFSSLIRDRDRLVIEIAQEIHANAQIATVKSRWVKRAIRTALAAAGMVAILAIQVGISTF